MKSPVNHSLFTDVSQQFREHLGLLGNERILFSGKYGHGKTTFLREFFNNNTNYKVLHLFPVNYSIATNEDIIRYIKYDLLVELLANDYTIKEPNEQKLPSLGKYLYSNRTKILRQIAGMVPKVGKEIVDFLESLGKIMNIFDGYVDSIDEKIKIQNEKYNKAIEFLLEIEGSESSIYEHSFITELIEETIKHNKGNTESILIIDDLDRIDPEHIFRILNVFAAHFDRIDGNCKFGFDKIIVVCDIENVRSIFCAKYGAKTDFNGYIDKFYSYEVFSFVLGQDQFFSFVKETLTRGVVFYEMGRISQGETHYKNELLKSPVFLVDVLNLLIAGKQIDLRNLVKWRNMDLKFQYSYVISDCDFDTLKYPILFYLQYLSSIKGDANSLIDALSKSGSSIQLKRLENKIVKNPMNHIVDLIRISTIEQHKNACSKTSIKLNGMPFCLHINEQGLAEIDSNGVVLDERDFVWTLVNCIEFLVKRGVLK